MLKKEGTRYKLEGEFSDTQSADGKALWSWTSSL